MLFFLDEVKYKIKMFDMVNFYFCFYVRIIFFYKLVDGYN